MNTIQKKASKVAIQYMIDKANAKKAIRKGR